MTTKNNNENNGNGYDNHCDIDHDKTNDDNYHIHEAISRSLQTFSRSMVRGSFYPHGLTLIPAWISNYIYYKVWDEVTYPFPKINGCTIEVWELI